MRPIGLLLSTIGLCGALAAGNSNASMPMDEDHFLRKRWYSVPEYPGKAADPYVYSWPVVCENPTIQPVYYCFQDKRSAENLGEVVNQAIAKWGHAMSVTALTFELDPAAEGDPNMPCSQMKNKLKDSLVISDESLDDPDPAKVKKHFNSGLCQTSTTLGYIYQPAVPFRHTLKFCDLQPWDPKGDMPHAVRAMAHELGHAIGLQHEHQRPDRNNYIEIHYKNIDGYDDVEALVKEDEEEYFPDNVSTKKRIDATCHSELYSRHYFPEVADFLAGNELDSPETQEKWKAYEFSQKFDYDSLMIYDSTSGVSSKAKKAGKYVMVRKDNKKPVWMGGSKNPDEWGISEGDIARVAMLYDAHTDECEKAKKGEVWGKAGTAPRSLKVKIRDVFEGVVHAPLAVRKRDEI